jgi:hypothetical protein
LLSRKFLLIAAKLTFLLLAAFQVTSATKPTFNSVYIKKVCQEKRYFALDPVFNQMYTAQRIDSKILSAITHCSKGVDSLDEKKFNIRSPLLNAVKYGQALNTFYKWSLTEVVNAYLGKSNKKGYSQEGLLTYLNIRQERMSDTIYDRILKVDISEFLKLYPLLRGSKKRTASDWQTLLVHGDSLLTNSKLRKSHKKKVLSDLFKELKNRDYINSGGVSTLYRETVTVGRIKGSDSFKKLCWHLYRTDSVFE